MSETLWSSLFSGSFSLDADNLTVLLSTAYLLTYCPCIICANPNNTLSFSRSESDGIETRAISDLQFELPSDQTDMMLFPQGAECYFLNFLIVELLRCS